MIVAMVIGIAMVIAGTAMPRRHSTYEAGWWFFGALGYGVIGVVCAFSEGATLVAIPLGWCAGWYTYIAYHIVRNDLDYSQ